MAQVELIMPKMGESVAEATIIKWLKNEGDKIAADEPVLEIATDKVDSEIPSIAEGVLVKKLFKEGDVVQVGKAVALISTDTRTAVASLSPNRVPQEALAVAQVKTHAPADKLQPVVIAPAQKQTAPAEHVEVKRHSDSGRFYSPLVRNIAKQENISQSELETIKGTGKDGRVTKSDIIAYIPAKGKQAAPAPSVQHTQANGATAYKTPAVSIGGEDEIIEMDRMRKLIADHMVMSKHVSPHVTSYVEADVTSLVMWRDKIKAGFEKREGEKITFTPIFIQAIARAIRDFPMVNVSVDGTRIIARKNINIGMATALPSGNLIVPVIKNADRLNILGLTKAVNDLANRARNNKLQPDEIQGGTYTITNVGSFGNVMGTPIINQPQVAIMAVGAIRKKPAVIETPQGDSIGIRHMMFLSHSYDHRVVDGALGGSFVRRVADYLEKFDVNTIV